MKIVTKTGNLFNVTKGHIVHGCNAQGVMGSGVALGVKNKWPHVYEDYLKEHDENGLVLGQVYPVAVGNELIVWNAITQGGFGPGQRQTSYDAVQTCFQDINDMIEVWPPEEPQPDQEIHIPLIGAARGGGNWEIIREIIEQTMNYPVTLWLPDATVQGTL